MEEISIHCNCCGKHIPHGDRYVCLSRNIEQLTHSPASLEQEVEVIQSDLLLALCSHCGRQFDVETLCSLIKLIPPRHRVQAN